MPIYKLFRYLGAILFVTAVLAVFVFRSEIDLAELEHWLANHPSTAPLVFIALYSVLVPLFFPSILLAVMGGVLYGPLWGAVYNEIGAVLGALLCFVIGRYHSTGWLERKLPHNLRQLKQNIDKEGWRFVLMVRLIPWLPYALLNYALGLTGIRLFHLLWITALCILPRVAVYSYLGHAGRMTLTGEEAVSEFLLLLPLFLAIIFLPYLVLKVRRSMKQNKT